MPDVFEWTKDNLENPYKVVSKTKWIPIVQTNLNWRRTESLKFTKNMKDEYPQLNNRKRT